MRELIARLLMELWRLPECVESVNALGAASRGGGGASPFAAFAAAALADLMYVLEDSLGRLVDIRDISAARADEAAWAALPPAQRADKERFLEGQQRAARGFMAEARTTLKLLNLLAATPATAAGFLQDGVAGPAAYAAVHFLELLLGPKCDGLKARRPAAALPGTDGGIAGEPMRARRQRPPAGGGALRGGRGKAHAGSAGRRHRGRPMRAVGGTLAARAAG